MRLTLLIFGAFDREISCPELQFSLVTGEEVSAEDLEAFYDALVVKSEGILEAGDDFFLKKFIPYARLFVDNSEAIKSRILEKEELLIEVP